MSELTQDQRYELTALFESSMNRGVIVMQSLEPYATQLAALDTDDLEGLKAVAASITDHDKLVFLESVLLGLASVLTQNLPWLQEYCDYFERGDGMEVKASKKKLH